MFDWRKKITLRGWSREGHGGAAAAVLAEMPQHEQASQQLIFSTEDIRDGLSQTIEAEIIPRLMLAHHTSYPDAHESVEHLLQPGPEDLIELAAAVLRDDGSAADLINAWIEAGADFETLALDLLAPTARHLGQLWISDLLDFTDVTIGTWRLQQLMQQAALFLPAPAGNGDPRKRILLLAAPGEQHSFGISMVAEFFRRDGWELELLAPSSPALIERCLENEWFAVVAISASTDARRASLAETVRLVRKNSCNRAIGIMVGGVSVEGDDEFARSVGADTTAVNARDALNKAQFLLTKVAVLG